jgi:hypothetical protein
LDLASRIASAGRPSNTGLSRHARGQIDRRDRDLLDDMAEGDMITGQTDDDWNIITS